MAQLKLPRRGVDYPSRPPFFFHRFVRLLGKVCAAQHVGPDGAWFLTYMAATEDSARYAHAVAWTDEQLSPLVGMSPSKLKRIRAKCLSHGWLHYEQGFKGVPSLYWVTVPERYDIRDGQYLDDELSKALRIRGHFDLESGQKAHGIRTQCELESGQKADAFIPTPATHSSACPSEGGGGFSEIENDGQVPEPTVAGQSPETTRPRKVPEPTGPSRQDTLPDDFDVRAQLVRRLRALGVSLAEPSLDGAIRQGLSLQHVAAVLKQAEAHPGYWGGGAIHRRLTCPHSAPLPADQGWAKPDATAVSRFRSQQQRDRSAVALAALTARHPAEPSIAVQQVWDWVALEATYGERIDRASIDDLAAMLGTDFARKLLRRAGGRQSLTVRRELLKAFATAAI